jgi:hypothetical protein
MEPALSCPAFVTSGNRILAALPQTTTLTGQLRQEFGPEALS